MRRRALRKTPADHLPRTGCCRPSMGLQVRCWLAAVAFGWLLAVAGCAEQLGSESLQQQQLTATPLSQSPSQLPSGFGSQSRGNSSRAAPARLPSGCIRLRSKRSSKQVSCFNSGSGSGTAAADKPETAPLLVLSGVAAVALCLGCLYVWYSHRRHSGPTYSQLSTQDDWTGVMGMEQWDEAGRAFSEQLQTTPRWRTILSRLSDLCAGRLAVSSNAKVLMVAICAFGAITVAQTVAAVFANSLALLGDCASMGVDTLTYCGNLYAEVVPQGSPRETKKAQLIASAASLLVLSSVTVAVVLDAKERIETETAALEAAAAAATAHAAAARSTGAGDDAAAAEAAGQLSRQPATSPLSDGVEEVNPYLLASSTHPSEFLWSIH